MIQLTEQQEKFVVAGYAAFADSDVIYSEFCEAFPEALNLFGEHLGEQESRVMLRRAINLLSRTHPKFPVERLGILFDSLRREYLNSQGDAFMGQSRNRLEVADDIRRRLLAYAEENPEHLPECMKLINDVLKEARTETATFHKLAEQTRNPVSPDELTSLLAKLPTHKRDEIVKELAGEVDLAIITQRIKSEVEEFENDSGKNSSGENQKILPTDEGDGQGQEQGLAEVQHSPNTDAEGSAGRVGDERESEDDNSETASGWGDNTN